MHGECVGLMAMNFYVFIVEAKYSGNIGSVARVLANFGLKNLVLIGPCVDINEESKRMAMRAQEILSNARHYNSLIHGFEDLAINVAIGTTAKITVKEKKIRRAAYPLYDIRDLIGIKDGNIALIFGREDIGLRDEELELCDIVITIPTDVRYPSMNISHAVACVLYELLRSGMLNTMPREVERTPYATKSERERLLALFKEFLIKSGYYKNRINTTTIMFRRLLGKANITRWEYMRLMGVFTKAMETMGDIKKK